MLSGPRMEDYSDDEVPRPNDIYQHLTQLTFQWPCLSFDVLFDNLGACRTQFPHSCSFVSATQASPGEQNSIIVTHLSNLQCTHNDDDAEDPSTLEPPSTHFFTYPCPSVTNRVRAMRQDSNVVATWGEDQRLCIWDISASKQKSAEASVQIESTPSFFADIQDEGYGLAWSNQTQGLLAIGTSRSQIQLWQLANGGFSLVSPFSAHTGSVEDIVFSPYDEPLLASCSTDGSVCVWDTRSLPNPILTIPAHDCDVNVIDWNPIQKDLLISGADNGEVSIWDIRGSQPPGEKVSTIDYHKDPITSIEWNPNDACEFVVACDDHSVTVWDISVENVDPEEAEEDIPDQLLFIHYSESPKEVHYHPQISEMIAVTGETFDVFIPDTQPGEEEEKKEGI